MADCELRVAGLTAPATGLDWIIGDANRFRDSVKLAAEKWSSRPGLEDRELVRFVVSPAQSAAAEGSQYTVDSTQGARRHGGLLEFRLDLGERGSSAQTGRECLRRISPRDWSSVTANRSKNPSCPRIPATSNGSSAKPTIAW